MGTSTKGVQELCCRCFDPHGLIVYRDTRLAQTVSHLMSEPVVGYSGTYQGQGRV